MTAETFGMQGPGGTLILYHRDSVNHCPSCGWSQWFIGRQVAECARCNAAIPLAFTGEADALSPPIPHKIEKEAA